MAVQMASTAPNGHAPETNPYTLDAAHPAAKAKMNRRPRCSRAYISIMNVKATTPKPVIQSTEPEG